MKNWIIKYFQDMKEGLKVLCSEGLWKDFRNYYSEKEIVKRIDAFTESLK